MKNYQFIVLAALVLGLAGYIVYNNKKKPCSCGDHVDDVSIEE